jgi:glucose/arabinose dehydrogenase
MPSVIGYRFTAATLSACLLVFVSCSSDSDDGASPGGSGGRGGAAGSGGKGGSGSGGNSVTGGSSGSGGITTGGTGGGSVTPGSGGATGAVDGPATETGAGSGGSGGNPMALPACSTPPAAMPPALKKTLVTALPAGVQAGQVVGVPGEPGLLYVIGHKNGKVYIIQNGMLLPTQLAEVAVAVNGNSEQGLLGIALHPSFASNHLFYLFYTGAMGGAMVVDEFERLTPTTSMKKGTIWNKPRTGGGTFHNGGSLYFNPKDSKPILYHSIGNNLSGDASNPDGVSGRIVAHDLEAKTATTYSHGFRNPYRMSIDRLTGDMWIGEVSQQAGGAIFFNPAGAPVKNFGFTTNGSEIKAGMSISGQDGSSGAIIGGVVYRGSKIPAICGRYFYGMWQSGVIKSMIQEGGKRVGASITHPGALSVGGLTSFGEDAEGEIYMSAQGGSIFKLEAM